MSQDNIAAATVSGEMAILQWQYALDKDKITRPSAEIWNETCRCGYLNVLKWFTEIGLGRTLTQDDIDVAIEGGHLHVLQWWASVDPEMPKLSERTLQKAIVVDYGDLELFEWALTRYPQKCTFLSSSDWMWTQHAAERAAAQGRVYVLNWAAHANASVSLIDRGLWKPCTRDIDNHVKDWIVEGSALFLVEKVRRVPSIDSLGLLISQGKSTILRFIRFYHSNWNLSQSEVDDVTNTRYGVKVLTWYMDINPEIPPPSLTALKEAHESGKLDVIEWYLSKYYSGREGLFEPGWRLDPNYIQTAANYPKECAPWFDPDWKRAPNKVGIAARAGHLHVLNRADHAKVSIIMPQLTVPVLSYVCESGRCADLEWYASVTPGWTLTQEEVDDAAARGHVDLLKCYTQTCELQGKYWFSTV
ncbi:hypothetical protein PSACC_03337 [Paramicrosporidium saccamoebae]|uniref:Uncharacterized protein n=1 Tax=Paramicrosporidium saccamoebae TaxID=1246581 RepID=A0A2H9TGF2_9FUNG|nr:hypothetical protein PSACC_03337 [Paramicrosporidium saccamoebae]